MMIVATLTQEEEEEEEEEVGRRRRTWKKKKKKKKKKKQKKTSKHFSIQKSICVSVEPANNVLRKAPGLNGANWIWRYRCVRRSKERGFSGVPPLLACGDLQTTGANNLLILLEIGNCDSQLAG